MYRQFINKVKEKNPYVRIIGLSGTPWKMSGPLAGTWICDEIIYKIEMSVLFKEEFLCPLITPDTSMHADTSVIPLSSSGEFNESAANEVMDNDYLIEAAINDALKYASDRKSCLIFASGIKHAERIKEALRKRNEKAEIIIGDTITDERTRIIDSFTNFEVRWLISVGTLTTGFNARNADLGIILRATQSSALWLQLIGRFLRLHECKENAMILDYGENISRFGAIDKIGPPPSREERQQAKRQPFKECFGCGKNVKALAKECPFCFVEFGSDIAPNHGTEASTDDIIEGESLIKDVKIDRVVAKKHFSQRSGGYSMRVSYHNGLEVIHEYLFFEGNPRQRSYACEWWSKFAGDDVKDKCPRHLDTAVTELKVFGVRQVPGISVDYSKAQKTSGGNIFGHKVLGYYFE